MKPLQLTMSGFRSYLNEKTIDFEGRSLFAIVGPTGAGKSSILDGVCYALYGKTPRVQSNTTALICSRSDAARVRLSFSVDGRTYEITRVVRRKGEGQNLFVDCSSGERVAGKAEVTARIAELIGLSFDAFCSSVLLAQNKFASFLEARPGEQMKTLKGIFRLDQMDTARQVAKDRTSALDLELSEVRGALGEIPADIAEQLHAAKRMARRTGEELEALEAAAPVEEALNREMDQAERELARAEQDEARSARSLQQIPRPEAFARPVEQDESLRAQLARADDALRAAVAAESEAQARFEDVQRQLGTPAELAAVQARVQERARAAADLDALKAKLVATQRRVDAAGAGLVRASENAARAAAALDEVLARRRELERRHSAHALRSDLEPGASCPVCEQIVESVPRGEPPAALADIEEASSTARRAAEEAAQAHAAALAENAAARRDAGHAAERVGEETAALARLDATIRAALGDVADPAGEIEERGRRVATAAEATTTTRAGTSAARTARDEVAAAEEAVASERRRLAAEIIGICGRVDAKPPPLDAPAAELEQCAASLRTAVADALDEARIRAQDASKLLEQARTRVLELRAKLGIEPFTPVAVAAAEARVRQVRALEEARRLEELRTRSQELAAAEKQLGARRDVYGRLAADLTDAKFIKFLLEDRRRLLSELGSGQLHALTGRYRFDHDFNVIDEFDAGKLRDVDTLSGGEIFLASLALALGLAEAVARQGGRLQSFFLDEGFGSLDAESLDLALDGIERVVSSDRVIGLVSHVPALAARIDDKIVLERGADGMTRVS